ncbi:glycine--tRNA ligase subunit beta [Bacillus sp. FJAT-49732]|uniref:Glycine--tRNA ligase beta subunit n=1 Tax=Lederbergia citrisecunda TaxID=2833583 RepID=A0A942TPH1_9BACI|nr:glycine--tRNA ligase subunit beta [Lederbergia citrisecunda]MBS4199702.1 glycine--tRNA ligase subunit beta [Lederbergia citrisecunda]
MSNRDLLLEIGIEEMPARFVNNAIRELSEKLESWFQDNKLSFTEMKLFSTPRRLAIVVKEVATSQSDTEEEVKGPAKKILFDNEGNWSKSALGFTKSNGITVDDIYFKEIKGVEYAHANKFIKGEATIKLLPQLSSVISSLHFPNSMRWGSQSLRFLRPIRWLVALFGNETVSIEIAGVQASNVTQGHRFLGEPIPLLAPIDYEKVLLGQYVLVDYDERKEAILEQIKRLEEEQDWIIPVDEDLLEEVTNLVEYPTVFFGTFNREFLKLPEEVLITSMKSHQRYFPVKNKNGNLLPYFVAVRNGDHRHIETVAKGNEKVLRARLSDADFFYQEDQKVPMEHNLKKLESIIYHEKIGTLAEKVKRIRNITEEIGRMVSLTDQELKLADRAAEICKFDLVSNMVNEFPELQGVMGEKYALQQGELPGVAKAIYEHYKPRHAEDSVPQTTIGSIISMADKLDSIVSSFAIGLIPTGSQDPYALRRQAAGIIQILLENEWNISLSELLKKVIVVEKGDHNDELYQQLKAFFKLRIQHLLEEKEIRYDLIEAVLGGDFNSVKDIVDRAETLQERKDQPSFKGTIESLSRVLNIAGKAELGVQVNPDLFENDYEVNLNEQWKQLKEIFESTISSSERFDAISSLETAISAYFDHTMVMADQEEIKRNRLALMSELAKIIGAYASVNVIVVK